MTRESECLPISTFGCSVYVIIYKACGKDTHIAILMSLACRIFRIKRILACKKHFSLSEPILVIITVAGYKGGIGKTTTAVHLAAVFQATSPTLFIDADENRSAQEWSKPGQLPFEVTAEDLAPKRIEAIRPENIVIDTKARPSPEDLEELSYSCDLLILPSTTRPMDLAVLVKTVQAIKTLQTPYKVLLTMVPPTSTRVSVEIKKLLLRSNIPVFETVIQKYAFIEQLPLDGTLVKQAKNENAAKLWSQYVQLAREVMV